MPDTEAIIPTVLSNGSDKELSKDTKKTLDNLTKKLHKNLQNTIENMVEIGYDLIQVKALIGHGKFLEWLEKEFDLSDQTARRFMHVAEVFGERVEILKHLSLRSVYALAAPSTPESAREAILKRIESGETLTFDSIQALCHQSANDLTQENETKPIKETSFRTEIKKVNKKLKGWGDEVEQSWKNLDGTLTKKSKQELETLYLELNQLTRLLASLLEQTKEASSKPDVKKNAQHNEQTTKKRGRPKKN